MPEDDDMPTWRELEDAMAARYPHANDGVEAAAHIINSECLSHTHRLLAVCKLMRLGLVDLDQVILLAEAHLAEADEEEV